MDEPTHKKITTGFVIQTYCGNKCIAQEFVAGDQVDYENCTNGDPIEVDDIAENEIYEPFTMVQPSDDGDTLEDRVNAKIQETIDALNKMMLPNKNT